MIPPTSVPSGVPVRFDPAAARSLARALVALADALDRAARRDDARQPDIAQDWRGCSRRWFDGRRSSAIPAMRTAADIARWEAAAVLRTVAMAADEQARLTAEALRLQATNGGPR